VDGGYRFSGRWQFSSGTDHCQWIFLGGLVADTEGRPVEPTQYRHFVLPRTDYTIIDDSWNVVGLKGTGSKDVVVTDAFVPSYRTMEALRIQDGRAVVEAGRDGALYRMPWSAIFPNGITAAVIGIAEGALPEHLAAQKQRVSAMGNLARDDAFAMAVTGEAASEIAACRAQLLANVSSMYELALAGKEIPYQLRVQGRRDQVRGSWRAVRAVDEIFARSGGAGLRTDRPLQRLWRDAHAGLNHFINVSGGVYQAYALTAMGMEPPDGVRLTI
jgi:alkylation response protein AidB-like acyl-CoA dehydrogenase